MFIDLVEIKKYPENYVVLIAGGRQPNSLWLEKIAKGKKIFCADKGLDYCYSANLIADFIIGDNDSASVLIIEQAKKRNSKFFVYDRDKSQTDFQISLDKITALSDEKCLLITGCWSGRFDHLYSLILTTLDWLKRNPVKVVLADDKELMFFMFGQEKISLSLKKIPISISLLPFSEESTVSINGVKWELKQADLKQSNSYMISNELKENNTEVNVEIFRGCIAVYICI